MEISTAQIQRVAKMSFASVYPHYIIKVEKKGRTKAELHLKFLLNESNCFL
jgi:hypothetical protein